MPESPRKIVLVGNPNCGKSALFNALTGLYVDVSNFPGTTVEVAKATIGSDILLDTPGVYGIAAFNDEERVTRDVVLDADVIVNVVNATSLERDLFLTVQCVDLGIPLVVAVNMLDEARHNGLTIDLSELERQLGVPVIGTVAVENKGLDQLKQTLAQARCGHFAPYLEPHISELESQMGTRGEALLFMEDDLAIAEKYSMLPPQSRETIYRARRQRVNEIFVAVVKEEAKGASFATRLGMLMLQPLTGLPMLALTLYAMFQVIGVFIAGTVVGFTEETIMLGIFEPAMRSTMLRFFGEGSIPYAFLAGEFGLLTMTPTYVFGLLLPLVIGFYSLLSILEDSGYLPRIAALMDRALTAIGLNGRAVIPLILGFGCVTMAAITTRLLGTTRERFIAIALLAITIPCSAQLGVIVGLIAPLGGRFVAIYLAVILSVFVVIGVALNKLLPGKSSDLLIDLPPIRLPRLQNVVKKTLNKSYLFLLEATPMFAIGALLITTLQLTGALATIEILLAPLTTTWLNLPPEAATSFIMGIIRRDFGAAGLASLALTATQTLVAMVTITLFVPCIAAVLVMFKERNAKEAVLLWMTSFGVAFLVGGLVARLVL